MGIEIGGGIQVTKESTVQNMESAVRNSGSI